MGSSIGNFDPVAATDFLKDFSAVLETRDTMLIGVDACQDKDKVLHAYNDREGKTHDFILNGLMHANKLWGKEVFHKDDWKVVGEYNETAGRHQAFVSPVRNVMIGTAFVEAGEKVRIEESYKYSLLQSTVLWRNAGLVPQARFGNRIDQYRKFFAAARPAFRMTVPVCSEFACVMNTVPHLKRFRPLLFLPNTFQP